MRTIHVRKPSVKIGGNQFYKSNRFSAPAETFCGAPCTDGDLTRRDCMNKKFNPDWFPTIGREVCGKCLTIILQP
jgi:hypothetical protein